MTMKGGKRKRTRQLLEVFDSLLLMEDLTSLEHYSLGDGIFRPILNGISLEILKDESWVIYGESPYELKLLLEIAGDMRTLGEGRRILFQEETSKSRSIREGLFYIDGAGMLPSQMNVLEAVMFATGRQGEDPVPRQDRIFESLISLGLGQLSLTPVKQLTDEEKAVVSLLIASYSDSSLIVFNLPEYKFNNLLIEVMAGIFEQGRLDDKAFVWASADSLDLESTCSHTAYLREGEILYSGSMADLLARYDKTLLVIEDEEAQDLVGPLTQLLPHHRVNLEDDKLLISDWGDKKTDPLALQELIFRAGLGPRQITLNQKTARRAFRTLAGGL